MIGLCLRWLAYMGFIQVRHILLMKDTKQRTSSGHHEYGVVTENSRVRSLSSSMQLVLACKQFANNTVLFTLQDSKFYCELNFWIFSHGKVFNFKSADCGMFDIFCKFIMNLLHAKILPNTASTCTYSIHKPVMAMVCL